MGHGYSKVTTSRYYIGYDKKGRVVNDANSDFYEYDSLGRVFKNYKCNLHRDPACEHPYIFRYIYSNRNLAYIELIKDGSLVTCETFKYDDQNRLVEYTKAPADTFKYEYEGNDTMKKSELWTYWTNDIHYQQVKIVRATSYIYDEYGRNTGSTWVDSSDMTSVHTDYSYDAVNRIIMQQDTVLHDPVVQKTNSCCLLYRTEFKYDNRNRITEELHKTGSFDNPAPHLQRKITFEFNSK